jgi:hypothetical protein
MTFYSVPLESPDPGGHFETGLRRIGAVLRELWLKVSFFFFFFFLKQHVSDTHTKKTTYD